MCGGVLPWEIAISLYPHEVLAIQVINGELDGGRFDWEAMQWMKDN